MNDLKKMLTGKGRVTQKQNNFLARQSWITPMPFILQKPGGVAAGYLFKPFFYAAEKLSFPPPLPLSASRVHQQCDYNRLISMIFGAFFFFRKKFCTMWCRYSLSWARVSSARMIVTVLKSSLKHWTQWFLRWFRYVWFVWTAFTFSCAYEEKYE